MTFTLGLPPWFCSHVWAQAYPAAPEQLAAAYEDAERTPKVADVHTAQTG